MRTLVLAFTLGCSAPKGGGAGEAAGCDPDSCAADACCAPSFVCHPQDGCVPDNGNCDDDPDCDAGFACSPDGICLPEAGERCDDANPCPKGQFCSDNGRCYPDGSCGVDGDCADAEYCSGAGNCIDDGTCAVDSDCEAGFECDGGRCLPGGDAGCGGEDFPIEAQPPNMLIVLDRSGSMDETIGGGWLGGGSSKWEIAKEAIAQILADYDDRIRFGLDVFSACTAGGCGPGIIVIEPDLGTQDAINTELAGTDLCDSGNSETNIGNSLDALVGEPLLQDASRQSTILLITDGAENCGGDGATAAAALLAQDLSVPTYVVGFGDGVDGAELSGIARAAETDRGGDPVYYQADDADELLDALGEIAAGVLGCDFLLAKLPPGEDIYVFFDDVDEVPRDEAHGEGWDYDPATGRITFYGAYCERLRSGDVNDVDVVFGCPDPVLK